MSTGSSASGVIRRLLGGKVESAARPLIFAVLIGSTARAVMITFTSIWAIRQLLATDRELSVAYAVAGVTAALVGYAAGVVADRLGGRNVLLTGWSLQAVVFACFALTGQNVLVGLLLIVCTTALATLCATASQTVVTELVPLERRTSGFAALRLGQNLGYALGPPVGALLLSFGWPVMFAVVALVAAAAAATVALEVPNRASSSPTRPSTPHAPLRTILTDTRFVWLYIASCLAMIVYSAEAVLLPVSLTEAHDLSPQTWGLLAVITPVLVIALQLRVVEWFRRVPLTTQVAVAVLLMGLPFLLLPVSSAVIAVSTMLVLYTVGEVLWAPAAQSLVSSHASAAHQSAYLGAFAATLPIGLSIGPLIGFQVRAAWGTPLCGRSTASSLRWQQECTSAAPRSLHRGGR